MQQGFGFTWLLLLVCNRSGFRLVHSFDRSLMRSLRSLRRVGALAETTSAASLESSLDDTFPLPIFPLRKQVRLPGDTLTLNLYEDRYLSMAGDILSSNQRIFGALYSSNKPQIMKGGQGPIVPLVTAGDVGVVCKVIFDEDSMVDTPTDGFRRRRIKLDAIAVGRFSVRHVLKNGYDRQDSDHPYILASVQTVDDVSPSPAESTSTSSQQLERKLLSLLKRLRNEGDAYLQRYLFAPGFQEAMEGKKRTASEAAYFDWASEGRVLEESRRRQMLSFAAATSLERNLPGNDLEWLLLTRSTTDRLGFILKALEAEQRLGPLKKVLEPFVGSRNLDEAS
mmetsp:Transcript_29871/g.44112  ORF Transcript_29871/g.44112 Transcript_29871/m.44112 type:complete len:338 (-) Transcript_29871:131-1144(-)